MRTSSVRISATISVTTKEALDRFVVERGLRTSFVVEQALLYFMQSHREVEQEAVVLASLVLDDDAFERVVERLEAPPAPTRALRELMRGKDG